MHIVIDARSRPESTGRYVDRLLDYLQEIDTKNSYTVLVRSGDDWLPKNTNFSSLAIAFKQFSLNPVDEIRFARLLYRLKPDVVHFGMTQQPLLYFGDIVTTTHDLTMLRFVRAGKHNFAFHFLRMRLYRFMFWWSHKKSNAIIVPTDFVAKDLAALQPFTSKKIVVTHESSEPPITGKAAPLAGVSKPFLLHVGSPFPHKNIPRLIEAFEKVHQSNPKLQLVLGGKKEFYFDKLMRQIAKSPAKDAIVVPGFVSSGELKWLYQNATAYVLPSLSEGFGLPGLEAMAHGCPLVSSNATCLPEVYGDAALYFNPYDTEDMTLKIDRILRDTHLQKELVARGKTQLGKYSWRRMAEQTLDVYTKVLGN